MKTRYRAEHFLPYDEERIIRHLERMAKKGWLLSSINKFFWIYRRIEPCTLKFGVTWCSGMSEYDSAPTEEQQLLWDSRRKSRLHLCFLLEGMHCKTEI